MIEYYCPLRKGECVKECMFYNLRLGTCNIDRYLEKALNWEDEVIG